MLVRGETGSGKELVAQAIHQLSQRKGQVMVKVNCAALPSGLVESELFGREKGAYTGAMTRQVGRFEVAELGIRPNGPDVDTSSSATSPPRSGPSDEE